MLNTPPLIDWTDGRPFSRRFGDVYFSADSGLEETRHVFLNGNRLAERFAALGAGNSLALGETGFGTGLNFLCAWRLFEQVAPPHASLDFFSVENFPLDDASLAQALGLWPELAAQADVLLARWRRRVPGWNRWSFCGGRVRLTLAISDVAQALPELRGGIDAWFLDGFSPARNPEMWAQPVLDAVAAASRPGATFATYTCAGWVRRGLAQAGFAVDKVPGFGSKREMLRGSLPGVAPLRHTPEAATVIGGGVAGCAAAAALAARGVRVSLLEAEPTLATAASGNPRGMLYLRLAAGMNALQRFVLASYGNALAGLDELMPIDGELRSECGLLQLAFSPQEAKRINRLAGLDWPAHVMRLVGAGEASDLAGIELAQGGLWFPGGGWVVPPQVCARLAAGNGVERHLGHRVTGIASAGEGWRVEGIGPDNRAWRRETALVIACTGHQVQAVAPLAHLPLTPVRGQISELPATAASRSLKTVVCGDGYCAPAFGGMHVSGATHGFGDTSRDLRPGDHADNLARLAVYAPALHRALGAASLDLVGVTGRASVRCSAPGAMPLVGEISPGLFASLAHGTRGLLTAGLAGELIAAAVCGQLLPQPASVVDGLAAAAR